MDINEKQNNKPLVLGWLDPRNQKVNFAGVSFYNEKFGEYFLKIDEEPKEKKYYLKPYGTDDEKVMYRLELVIKKTDGTFLKRQHVGDGHKDSSTDGNVHIDYGSKFKTLVLYMENK